MFINANGFDGLSHLPLEKRLPADRAIREYAPKHKWGKGRAVGGSGGGRQLSMLENYAKSRGINMKVPK